MNGLIVSVVVSLVKPVTRAINAESDLDGITPEETPVSGQPALADGAADLAKSHCLVHTALHNGLSDPDSDVLESLSFSRALLYRVDRDQLDLGVRQCRDQCRIAAVGDGGLLQGAGEECDEAYSRRTHG